MSLHAWKSHICLSAITLVCAAGLSACSSTGGTSGTETGGSTGAMTNGIFSNPNELDYTAATEQVHIAPSDMLEIKVFQADELSGKVRVESDGTISLPLIGNLKVAGLTPTEVENRIKSLLSVKYLQDPQVTVFLENFTNQRVTIEGEVKKPGVYPITGSVTLLQAVAMGEGLDTLADPAKIVLLRRVGNQTRAYDLNLSAIRNGKMRDPYIMGDDRIIVHRSDSRYWLREAGTLLSPLNVLKNVVP
jgi:polysaccharide export outer membrane protein